MELKTHLNASWLVAGVFGSMLLSISLTDHFSSQPAKAMSTACSSPNFSAPANFPTGENSSFAAVGDFNEDGKPDLVVTNGHVLASDVSLLLGDGAGSFGAAKHFPVGRKPVFVVAGDFNADQNLDFATANKFFDIANRSVPGTVTVRLGDGHGDFAPPINTPAGYVPSSLAAGDFNNDGKLDLAVGNEGFRFISEGPIETFPGGVTILLGDGKGGFSTSQTSELGGSPTLSIAAGDLNGDGNPDLAVGTTALVSILIGNGAGTFTIAGNLATTSSPVSVVLGDFNRDGKLDLANVDFFRGGQSFDTITIRPGNGAGTFGAAASFPVAPNPEFVAAGDFNLDGNLDLVIANGKVHVTLGDGSGGFAPPTSYEVLSNRIATGDFNNDGKFDLAVIRTNGSDFSSPSHVSILRNICGTPTPSPTPQLLALELSNRAVAVDSVTMIRDPFPFTSTTNLSSDQRTRIVLMAMNIDLQPGEDAASITVRAENSQHAVFSIPAEYVGKVPRFSWLTQVNVRLPDALENGGDVSMSLIYRGMESNKVLITIKPPAN